MAKQANPTTIHPERFLQQAEILVEDAVAVLEMANYAAAEDTPTLLSFAPFQGPGARWPDVSSSGFERRYLGRVLVDADMQVLRLAVRAELPVGNTGNVRVRVGPVSRTLVVSPGMIATVTETFDVASTGTGWLEVEVEMERVTRITTIPNGLESLTLQVEPIAAASLPDPD